MKLGEWGENVAARYLKHRGYDILERNFRCIYGEMDIIAKRPGVIAFIEVKTRNNLSYGLPCESINKSKIRHLRKIANYYLFQLPISKKNLFNEIRIDVIEILILENKTFLKHIKNIA